MTVRPFQEEEETRGLGGTFSGERDRIRQSEDLDRGLGKMKEHGKALLRLRNETRELYNTKKDDDRDEIAREFSED